MRDQIEVTTPTDCSGSEYGHRWRRRLTITKYFAPVSLLPISSAGDSPLEFDDDDMTMDVQITEGKWLSRGGVGENERLDASPTIYAPLNSEKLLPRQGFRRF